MHTISVTSTEHRAPNQAMMINYIFTDDKFGKPTIHVEVASDLKYESHEP